MSSSDRFGEALQARVMLAILAASAGMGSAACRKEATPARPEPVDAAVTTTTKPEEAGPVTIPEAPATPSAESPTVTPSAATPKPAALAPRLCGAEKPSEHCYAPFTNARSTGTGEPAPAPPPSAYDKDGCLPKSKVSNGCCNPAVDGPRLRGGQCCYSFCPGPCCGRPFLAGGAPRVAALVERGDWLARDLAPRAAEAEAGALEGLDAHTASRLRQAWLGDAQMEHASAAAFGRFVLQLLALGAPPAFVRDAALAAADEVRHAELCFALAARAGGAGSEAFGPMPLALDGALDARTLEEVIAEVIVEGCVGETLAALVASRQLEGARDPAVRDALEQICADEAKHAELAWSFVRWAVGIGGESARKSAMDAFDRALRGAEREACDEGAETVEMADAWHAFGRLSAKEQSETARRGLREVVAPCARALLESTERAS